mmetsp:Transcript_4349/g.8359  ORF Transcript_4349/g.8359 Transcript_4349/m.8359 type:complete len:228 (-) Transcript_4349:318-1001(-)
MTGMAIDTGTHSISIILNTENHGKFPKTGHICTLPNLSLISSTITITRNRDIHLLTRFGIVLVGKSQSSSHRNLCTNNSLPPKEIIFLGVKVHGTSLTLGHPSCISKQLCKNRSDVSSASKSNTMATIGGDPRILRRECSINSRSNSFLSIVKVAKSTDIACFVFIVACNFHSTHGVHEAEVRQQFILGHRDFIIGCSIQVMRLKGTSKVKRRRVGRQCPAATRKLG